MPVETPRTPDFTDALEARLRADAARGAGRGGRGPDAGTALIVAAALVGGTAFVIATAGEGEQGEPAVGPARTAEQPGIEGRVESGRGGLLRDPRTKKVLGRMIGYRGSSAEPELVEVTVYASSRGVPLRLRIADREYEAPADRQQTARWVVPVDAAPEATAEVAVLTRRGGRRSTLLRGTLSPPSQAGGSPVTDAVVQLLRPGGALRGEARVLRERDGDQRALSIAAFNLAAGSRYVVWIDGRFVGFAPPVKRDRYLSGLAPLDDDVRPGARLLITREKVDRPTSPGQIVLRATLP